MNEHLPRIRIIIPWFGPWPDWMQYFLAGCRVNPEISWLLQSDQPLPDGIPENVKLQQTSFRHWIDTAEEKLGFRLNVKHPYKLCDLKPAYGFIFSDQLDGFDFWGYGDLDLVYGRFYEVFAETDFRQLDVLSSHPGFVPAHLCLLRNTGKIRELFMSGEGYRKTFTDARYTGFDEQLLPFPLKISEYNLPGAKKMNQKIHEWIWRISKYAGVLPGVKTAAAVRKSVKRSKGLQDFNSILRYHKQANGLRIDYAKRFECDNMYRKRGITSWEVRWENGKLYAEKPYPGNSLLYFHFMLSKEKAAFIIEPTPEPVERFKISPGGIRSFKA